VDKIAVVQWYDAEHESGPLMAADVAKMKLPTLETVGFVARDDDDMIVVVMEHQPCEDWMRNATKIPREWVRAVRYIDHPAKPAKKPARKR
jgi:hypothetical protein